MLYEPEKGRTPIEGKRLEMTMGIKRIKGTKDSNWPHKIGEGSSQGGTLSIRRRQWETSTVDPSL